MLLANARSRAGFSGSVLNRTLPRFPLAGLWGAGYGSIRVLGGQFAYLFRNPAPDDFTGRCPDFSQTNCLISGMGWQALPNRFLERIALFLAVFTHGSNAESHVHNGRAGTSGIATQTNYVSK